MQSYFRQFMSKRIYDQIKQQEVESKRLFWERNKEPPTPPPFWIVPGLDGTFPSTFIQKNVRGFSVRIQWWYRVLRAKDSKRRLRCERLKLRNSKLREENRSWCFLSNGAAHAIQSKYREWKLKGGTTAAMRKPKMNSANGVVSKKLMSLWSTNNWQEILSASKLSLLYQGTIQPSDTSNANEIKRIVFNKDRAEPAATVIQRAWRCFTSRNDTWKLCLKYFNKTVELGSEDSVRWHNTKTNSSTT